MRYELVEIDADAPLPVAVPRSARGLGLVVRRHDRVAGFAMQRAHAGSTLSREQVAAIATRFAGARQAESPGVPGPRGAGGPPGADPGAGAEAASSLSVLVCTRDRPELLARCLSSLRSALALLAGVASEIVVVDNAPSDERTRRVVAAAGGGGARYVLEPTAGLDVARNTGLREASGDLVAFVDDDAVVDRHWAESLVAAWRNDPEAVVVTGSVLPYELESGAQILFELAGGFTAGFARRRYRQPDRRRLWRLAATCGVGCNMSVRRTSALELGGFDENLDSGPPLPGGGDIEFFHRVLASGGVVVYEPSVAVFHQHPRALRAVLAKYRSWGTTWATAVSHGGRDKAPRRRAWPEVAGWYLERCRWLPAGGWPAAVLLAAELTGVPRGLSGEYERSLRRMELRRSLAGQRRDAEPLTVAVLVWGQVFEDYLGGIGLDLDDFVEKMSGGWLFGYVQALEKAGLRALLVVVSSSVQRPERRLHGPTGAAIQLLPSPRPYRWLRRLGWQPYAYDWREAASGAAGVGRLAAVLGWAAGSWLSTPLATLARVLRAEGCDVLLCQEYEEARFDLCCASRRLLGVRLFATFQGGAHTRWFERPSRGWAIRHAEGLIIGDEREAARVVAAHGADPSRIARIPNPLDIEAAGEPATARDGARRRLGLPPDAPVVLWYGRVDRHNKGLDLLLDAWDLVTDGQGGGSPVLVMLGTGPDAPWLHRRLACARSRVEWRDEYVLDRSLIAERLAAADVFVQPSRHEGFAVAPMEAMAMAVPVIAADVAGIRQLLAGDAGVVVPGEDVEALAGAIRLLLDDPELASLIGRRGRERVEAEFSLEKIGNELAALFAPARSFDGVPG